MLMVPVPRTLPACHTKVADEAPEISAVTVTCVVPPHPG